MTVIITIEIKTQIKTMAIFVATIKADVKHSTCGHIPQ